MFPVFHDPLRYNQGQNNSGKVWVDNQIILLFYRTLQFR